MCLKEYNILDEYKKEISCLIKIDYENMWPPWLKNYTEYNYDSHQKYLS